jgi:hypothetical protein
MMNPRWRHFLLVLTLIACATLHAPRLHQMRANPVVAPALQSIPATHAPTPSIQIADAKWQLQPWTFDESPLPPIVSQDFSLYLVKEQITPPTRAQWDAAIQDVAFFAATEFADERASVPAFRTVGPFKRIASSQQFAPRPRHALRVGGGANYVRTTLYGSSPVDFPKRAMKAAPRTGGDSLAHRPVTSDGDGTIVVGETPDPVPVAGLPDPTPIPGQTSGPGGHIGDPGTGGFGGGVGGLPSPGSEIPEPTFVAPLCFVAILLRRSKSRHPDRDQCD